MQKLRLVSVFVACVLFLQVFVLPVRVAAAPREYQSVESYSIETLSNELNEDGFYEVTGYKKVNAFTSVWTFSDSMKSHIEVVEDYYDLNGNFINSIVKSEDFENDLTIGKAKHKQKIKEFDKPKTMFVTSSKEKFHKVNLSPSEEQQVKSHIQHLTEQLPDSQFKSVQGFTKAQPDEAKKVADELIKSGALQDVLTAETTGTTEAKGAFDNYYNHNLSTGSFVAQALGSAGHKYIKVTGSTYGSTKNATSMTSFKSHINNYEYYVVQRMEWPTWTEVASWFGV